MNKHGMTWKEFSEVYDIGITEHISHDVEIVPCKFGLKPKLKGRLFDNERNTGYSFNVYNLKTDKDVLTSEWMVDTVDEIIEIIEYEFNIVADDIIEEIERHLKIKWNSVFTSHTIMPEDIMNEMVDDVLEASGDDGFNDSDIEFAFQNVILYRLFSE